METLILPAALNSLTRAREFVLSEAERAGLRRDRFGDVELALEELAVNIITHAYGGAAGEFKISCGQKGSDFAIELQDGGAPFDPFERSDPDVSKPLEEREVGGLGIYLVKKLADRVRYERRGDINWIEIRFRL